MSRFKLHLFALTASLAMGLLVACFAFPAFAQSAEPVIVPDPSNVEAFAQALLGAVKQEDKSFAVVLALIAIVAAARRTSSGRSRHASVSAASTWRSDGCPPRGLSGKYVPAKNGLPSWSSTTVIGQPPCPVSATVASM